MYHEKEEFRYKLQKWFIHRNKIISMHRNLPYLPTYNLHQDGIFNLFLTKDLFDKCHLDYEINYKFTMIFEGVFFLLWS